MAIHPPTVDWERASEADVQGARDGSSGGCSLTIIFIVGRTTKMTMMRLMTTMTANTRMMRIMSMVAI